MSFHGKTVFITGASTGIGRALALALGAEGAKVGLFARRLDLLTTLAEEVRQAGGEARAYALDMTDRAGVAERLAEAEAALGPVDLLIANAGIADPVSARRYDAAKAARVFEVNVLGVIYALAAVLPGMVARRQGHVVGISSLAAYRVFPGGSSYSGSKAGLSMLLRGLRSELAPHGVCVSTICPGFIRTELTQKQRMPMPFMLDCDVATRRILAAIRRRRAVYNFPRRMYWLMQASRLVPDRLIFKLMSST